MQSTTACLIIENCKNLKKMLSIKSKNQIRVDRYTSEECTTLDKAGSKLETSSRPKKVDRWYELKLGSSLNTLEV